MPKEPKKIQLFLAGSEKIGIPDAPTFGGSFKEGKLPYQRVVNDEK